MNVDVHTGNVETQIDVSLSLFPPNVEENVTMKTLSPTAVNPEPKEMYSTDDEDLSGDNVDEPGRHEGTNESLSLSPSTENTPTMNTMSTTAVDLQEKREGKNKPLSFSPSTKNGLTINTMSTTAESYFHWTRDVTEEKSTTQRASRNGSLQGRSVLLWNLGCFIMSVSSLFV
ncbi:uncharacterized protein LOC134688171 [Mytilus trossulus]|uniref:uncharacterized protein LOC134688171 n=1 Tax=Mytilus trossulus TaxID=6551 RepID=UPI0030072836